jgi:hypothetical protein
MYRKCLMKNVYKIGDKYTMTQATYVPRNKEERSLYHCYRAKARRITYTERVFVA